MFTYQLQPRAFRGELAGTPLNLPNNVRIDLVLAPSAAFGASNEPSRSPVRGVEATMDIDPSRGKATVLSKRPLKPISVSVGIPNQAFTVTGDRMTVDTYCKDAIELDGVLRSLLLAVPVLLNIDLADTPHFVHISGKVGDTSFRWELAGLTQSFSTTTQERREEEVARALQRYTLFTGSSNRTLLAALHYFHVACRLAETGNTPWEFMAERILNYEKILDSLFVANGEDTSREQVRLELIKLGYRREYIEAAFIPVLLLRDQLDVAHPSFSILPAEFFQELQFYLNSLEGIFRELIKRVVNKVESGTYALPREPVEIEPSSKKLRDLSRLRNSLSKIRQEPAASDSSETPNV